MIQMRYKQQVNQHYYERWRFALDYSLAGFVTFHQDYAIAVVPLKLMKLCKIEKDEETLCIYFNHVIVNNVSGMVKYFNNQAWKEKGRDEIDLRYVAVVAGTFADAATTGI